MNEKGNNFWKTLFNYTSDHRKNLVLTVIFSIINGISVAFAPLVIKYVIDDAILNDALAPEIKLKRAAFY